MKNKKPFWLILKITLSLSLFAYVLYSRFNLSIFRELKFIGFWFFLLFINSLIITFFRVVKWDFLLKKFFRQKYSFKKNWHIILIGQFFAFFTPSRLGDLIRIKYTKKELGYKKSLAAVLADRVFDLGIMVILGLGGFVLWFPVFKFNWNIFFLILVSILVLSLSFFILFRKKILKKYQVLKKFFKKNFLSKNILVFALLTLVVWFLTYSQFFIAFLSLGVKTHFSSLFWLVSLAMIVIMLPISINGIGVREYIASALFPLLNIKPATALLCVWLVMLANSIFPALLGLISFLVKKKG